MVSNIVLIGMPGSGKSTVGFRLARALGMNFIDTDVLLERKEGRLLIEIIRAKGLKGFLKAEEATVLKLNVKNSVISTGGSVVYSDKAMKWLKQKGVVIYLKVDYKEIRRRLRNIATRGIVFGRGQNLAGLYAERIPLYEKYSDITIECDNKNFRKIIGEIKETIKNL